MGSHAEKQSPWARFRQWRRYRRFLAALVREARHDGWPLTPQRIERMKTQAREAARRTGD